jgi:hypothetical protein
MLLAFASVLEVVSTWQYRQTRLLYVIIRLHVYPRINVGPPVLLYE